MFTETAETHDALGGEIVLNLVTAANDKQQAIELLRAHWKTIFSFEKQFSRFIPNSELSQFNNRAGSKVIISPEFTAILLVAQNLAKLTDGLFNPFILPALQKNGYRKSALSGYENDDSNDYSERTVVNHTLLEIGDGWARIPYGTAIDLGGCGKGYLADLLAKATQLDWVRGYWFSIGGDIAGGGHTSDSKPWNVYIADPTGADTGKYFIQSSPVFGVATSSTLVRKGNGWHHIIDPRTLKPAKTDIALSSIMAESAVLADVLASCSIIVGSARAIKMLPKKGARAGLLFGNSVATFGEIRTKELLRV